MKINKSDLERWKTNSLETFDKMNIPSENLDYLQKTKLRIIPGNSEGMFYGWAYFLDNEVAVYESNPSKYLPSIFQEVWNQSGMDHELIGHLYGNYRYGEGLEDYARQVQIDMAKFRGKKSFTWNLASFILPSLFNFKK